MSKKTAFIVAVATLALIFVLMFGNATTLSPQLSNVTQTTAHSLPLASTTKEAQQHTLTRPALQPPAKKQPALPLAEQVFQTVIPQALPVSNDKTVHLTFIVDDRHYSVTVASGSSVFDAMKELASTTPFSFTSTYYSGLGYFTNSLNGRKNANGHYWTLYINGAYSTSGASSYVAKDNDVIEWKYQQL